MPAKTPSPSVVPPRTEAELESYMDGTYRGPLNFSPRKRQTTFRPSRKSVTDPQERVVITETLSGRPVRVV